MPEIAATCLAYEEELSALIDGELSVEREVEVRAHLDACARCRARVEELCNVDLALASAELPVVPAELRQRLAARIARDAAGVRAAPRRAPPRRVFRRLAAPAAGLAAAAALALALYTTLRPALTPEAPVLVAGPEPRPEAVEPPVPVVPEPASLEVAREPAPDLGEAELDALPEEELAVVMELDTIQDYDVIANLDLLERFLDLGEGAG